MGVPVFASLVLLGAAAAHAGPTGSASNELSGSSSSAPGYTTSFRTVSDAVMASLDLSEQWSVTFGAMLTVEGPQPPAAGSPFETKAGAVPWFTAGVDYDLGDHWTFGATLDASPSTTRRIPTQLVLTTTGPRGAVIQVPIDALLRSANSSLAGGLSAGWDSAGDSDLELGFTASATASHLSSDQALEKLQREIDGTVVTREQAIALCNAAPKSCPRGLLATLAQQQYALDALRLSATGTLTILDDTDVTLGVDGYLYNGDPSNVGYFRVATAGRTSFSGGAGVPIAPLTIQGRAEVVQRLGDFSARLFGTAGKYAQDTASRTYGAGLKLQYRFTKEFRLWLSGSGQWDQGLESDTSRSGTLVLGAAVRF